jgi:hypothetical protein
LRAIAKKNTLFRMKLKFVLIVWTNMRLTSTTKNLEKSVIRGQLEKLLNRSFHAKHTCRQAINEETGCKERITPKVKRHGGMSETSKPFFENMMIFALSNTIPLMCMRTGYMM